MFYPAYIHKDRDSAYSVSFPDFPGCFTAADNIEDIQRAANEAVELYFEGEDIFLPPPSSPETWVSDERFQGGFWLMVNLDADKLQASTKAVRINISLPGSLVRKIDSYVKAQSLTRSGFLARAAMHEMSANEATVLPLSAVPSPQGVVGTMLVMGGTPLLITGRSWTWGETRQVAASESAPASLREPENVH